MELIKKNRVVFLLLTTFVVILILLTVQSILFPPLKIKSLSPSDGSANVPIDTIIEISFDKNPGKERIEASFLPNVQTELETKDNIVKIKPVPSFRFNTTYILIIKDRVKNTEVGHLQFTTMIPQGTEDTSEEAKRVTQESYPLAPFTPPVDAPFYFTYTGPLQLKVFLKGNQETAKEEFLAWVKSQKVDLSTHQISYTSPP